MSREERIEAYYHEDARELAEKIVDLEEEIEGWKRVLRMAEDEIEFLNFGRRLPPV